MTEKEMAMHIKQLAKVIETQVSYAEQLTRRFYNMERQIAVFSYRLAKFEGMKND